MSGAPTLVAGVDGCPPGWVAAIGPIGGAPWLVVEPIMGTLVERHPRVVRWAVDIPIGLEDATPRECDALARKRLGPKRGPSVFPAPPRAVARYADEGGESYAEACRRAAEATGKKVSKQAWNITPKIAEVRRFLIENRRWRDRLFECHPELAFARLAGGDALAAGKKTLEGGLQRRRLLGACFGDDCVDRFVSQSEATRGLHVDDTLDAMACWTAAARAAAGEAESLPSDPPRDADGLEIAIRW